MTIARSGSIFKDQLQTPHPQSYGRGIVARGKWC